ncbi:predicted protein [Naegleria gruberi]|uniref:Predicted protein n=1 Tax=Naegleria gruberi TaxID=5762 RepID=D2W3R1_NAEGR|nr:uncharacterized protein NAEGRDRAFT_76036 [Naegleria gruberi]EFC36281.1 predicted protein [Naegleria gruberi]|eukprot:XP_002669025.1 predicted protein [Naegleria gruberi strain NEG-M]
MAECLESLLLAVQCCAEVATIVREIDETDGENRKEIVKLKAKKIGILLVVISSCLVCFLLGVGSLYLVATRLSEQIDVQYVHNCCFAVGTSYCYMNSHDSNYEYCEYKVSYAKLSPTIVSNPNQFNSSFISEQCQQIMPSNTHAITTFNYLKKFTPNNSTICYSNAEETIFTFNEPIHTTTISTTQQVLFYFIVISVLAFCFFMVMVLVLGFYFVERKGEKKDKSQYEEIKEGEDNL